MVKKFFKFCIIFFITFVFWGCFLNPFEKDSSTSQNETSQNSSIVINNIDVSPSSFSRNTENEIKFSWNVNYSCSDKFYYLDIYLSRDDKLDSNDFSIFHTYSTSSNGSITLLTNEEPLSNAYGGKYYVLFSFYCDNNTPVIKAFSNFTIKTKWTFMIYMDGDNSLDPYTDYDLNEMERVGSSNDVNIVVEKDDYGPAGRYFIKPYEEELLENLGEVDMGDSQTLINFGLWTIENFPADHYVLVLWNHGGGFKRAFDISTLILKDICEDTSSGGDAITMSELRNALSAISQRLGHKIDIVGMDACLMGMLEVAYEIKDFTDFMVASENTEPGDGWPYDKVLEVLINNPDISPENFAKEIVEKFISSYSSFDEATQSAIDLSQIGNLTLATDKLAKCLINELNNDPDTLTSIFQNNIFPIVQRFDDLGSYGIGSEDSYVDLFHLAYLINQNIGNCSQEAEEVINTFNATIIASNNTGPPVENAYGLSIWLPPDIYTYQDYADYYNSLSFANATSWDDFLNAFWNQ